MKGPSWHRTCRMRLGKDRATRVSSSPRQSGGLGQARPGYSAGGFQRMKSVTRIAWGVTLFAGLAVAGVRPVGAQIINGGFEAPDAGGGFVTYFAPSVPAGFGWSLD